MPLTDPILEFQRARAAAAFQPPALCSSKAFPLLLAGVPALRKTPGLATMEDAGEEYFTSIPFCLSKEDQQAARTHLSEVFGITDKDSLIAFCQNTVHIHQEYLDFESFWEDRPNFSLDELTPQALSGFQRLSDFARQFQPIGGRRPRPPARPSCSRRSRCAPPVAASQKSEAEKSEMCASSSVG